MIRKRSFGVTRLTKHFCRVVVCSSPWIVLCLLSSVCIAPVCISIAQPPFDRRAMYIYLSHLPSFFLPAFFFPSADVFANVMDRHIYLWIEPHASASQRVTRKTCLHTQQRRAVSVTSYLPAGHSMPYSHMEGGFFF